MLPLDDRRSEGDGADSSVFGYRGIEYEATVLADLRGDPRHRFTEVVAGHFARRRLFAQVILVLEPSQAPEADAILSASMFRMRGYVEAAPPAEGSGRDPDRRMVLSEVVLDDLTLTDAHDPSRRLFASDCGWSIFEERTISPSLSPWSVLSEALFVAVDACATAIGEADLSGGLDVRTEVALELAATASTSTAVFGALSSPPAGWAFAATSSAARPEGWKAEGRCSAARLEQRQTTRFHRVLGPYRPNVELWACPIGVALRFDSSAEFPARYLGAQRRMRYFARALGESNWPNAIEQIAAHLAIEPPAQKYTFDLEAE